MTEAAGAAVGAPERVMVTARADEIDGDPYNVRATLTGIERLADSIARWGLLENLVGVEIADSERSGGRWIQLRAGSRRFAAIEQLIEQGRLPPEHPIPVLLIDSDGVWENLVENIQRTGVQPWDVGRRLGELAAGGMDYRTIGARIGKTNGWVSRRITIGQGIAPETVEHITARGLSLDMGVLFRLACMKDRYGDPDGAAQIAAIEARKRRRPRKRLTPDNLRAFGQRINYMRTHMPVPPMLLPTVTAVLDYLDGGGKPNLSALAADIETKTANKLRVDDD